MWAGGQANYFFAFLIHGLLMIGMLLLMLVFAFRNIVLAALIAVGPVAWMLFPVRGVGPQWVVRYVSAVVVLLLTGPLTIGFVTLIINGLASVQDDLGSAVLAAADRAGAGGVRAVRDLRTVQLRRRGRGRRGRLATRFARRPHGRVGAARSRVAHSRAGSARLPAGVTPGAARRRDRERAIEPEARRRRGPPRGPPDPPARPARRRSRRPSPPGADPAPPPQPQASIATRRPPPPARALRGGRHDDHSGLRPTRAAAAPVPAGRRDGHGPWQLDLHHRRRASSLLIAVNRFGPPGLLYARTALPRRSG